MRWVCGGEVLFLHHSVHADLSPGSCSIVGVLKDLKRLKKVQHWDPNYVVKLLDIVCTNLAKIRHFLQESFKCSTIQTKPVRFLQRKLFSQNHTFLALTWGINLKTNLVFVRFIKVVFMHMSGKVFFSVDNFPFF